MFYLVKVSPILRVTSATSLSKKKIISLERKECIAEGKTSASQIPSFISAMFYKFSPKKYTYQMLLSSKTKKSFQK
jgi:hypothetical protein